MFYQFNLSLNCYPNKSGIPVYRYTGKTIFLEKNDEYQKERNNLRTLIYPDLDGKACQRITQSVMSLND